MTVSDLSAPSKTVIAEIAVLRESVILGVLSLVAAAFVWVGLRTDQILLLTDTPARHAAGFTTTTFAAIYFAAMPLQNLWAAWREDGAGLYVEDRRLVCTTCRRSVSLDQIASVGLGPEGMFEGEPRSLTLFLREGGRLSVYTRGFGTPVATMIDRLRAAGMSAPIAQLTSEAATDHGA